VNSKVVDGIWFIGLKSSVHIKIYIFFYLKVMFNTRNSLCKTTSPMIVKTIYTI